MARLLQRCMATRPKLNALYPEQDQTQFSKAILRNFGELETGEVPEALKFDRPVQMTTLSNQIRVATDHWPGPLATVGIMIEAGSRNESMSNAGTAHLLEHLHFKGTYRRSRIRLESEIEDMGGNLNAYTSRETTLYQMQVFPRDVPRAMDIMTDMILNSKYDGKAVEQELEVVLAEANEVDADRRELVLENVHYAAYRDHQMGQPILGNRRSIPKLTSNDLRTFVSTHYIGPRMVVVGGGPVDHQQLVDLTEKHMGKVAISRPELSIIGEDEPLLTGSQVNIRDDDVDMTHMGLFFPAPSWKHPDYFAFLILQRLMGDYDPKRDSLINHARLQYNYLHTWLGENEDVGKHECLYVPYKNSGLIGHYVSCLDLGAHLAAAGCMKAMRRATSYIMEAELYRAKNKIYNELLNTETGSEVIQTLASQLIYMNRRVPRSEIAKRISSMDARFLEKTYTKWLWDCELALAFYGPTFMVGRDYNIYRAFTNDQNLLL